MRDWSWKAFRAENTCYSSGSSVAPTAEDALHNPSSQRLRLAGVLRQRMHGTEEVVS